jgi:mRNA-degrading endonuclease YafQ of YafQ-DinJ toxin-antitoxin module
MNRKKYEFDILFNEINNDFKKEDILLKFMRQKEAIIEQGKKIIKNLEKEISSLDKQLQKHQYLGAVEDSSISPHKPV